MTHLQPILTNLRYYLEQLYGDRLVQVMLYGSQARGDARSDSDIDVLIVLHEPLDPSQEIKRTSQFIAQLCLENNVLISRSFASPAQVEAEQRVVLQKLAKVMKLLGKGSNQAATSKTCSMNLTCS